jgi:hypothetical protein
LACQTITGYTLGPTPAVFQNACNMAGATVLTISNTDDGTAAVTLPFNFALYSTVTTSAWASSNGVLGIGSTANAVFSNACLPSTGAPLSAIFPFWDDLITRSPGVCTAVVGTTVGSRQFFATWNDARFYASGAGDVTFTVILNEHDFTIDVLYGTMSSGQGTGTSATVGIQNAGGTVATQEECNVGGIRSNSGFRLTPR